MQTILGLDVPASVRYVLALAFVLVLAAIGGVILRRISAGRRTLKGQSGGRARQPRLGVVDIYDLDRQRQLVLLRRDNVEHLVMIGGPTDVVVETNIVRGQSRAQMPASAEQFNHDRIESDMMPAPSGAPLAAPAPAVPPMAVPPPVLVPAPSVPNLAPATALAGAASVSTGSASMGSVSTGSILPVEPPVVDGASSNPPPPAPTIGSTRPASSPKPNSGAAGFAPTMPFPLEPAPASRAPAADLDDMTRQLAEALQRPQAAVRSAAPAAAPAPAPAATLPLEPAKLPVPVSEKPRDPVDPPAGNRVLSFEELMGQQLSAAIDLREGPGVDASANAIRKQSGDRSSPATPLSTTPTIPMPPPPAVLVQAVAARLEDAVANSLGVVQDTPSDAPDAPENRREPPRDASKARPMTTPTLTTPVVATPAVAPRPQQTSGLAGSEAVDAPAISANATDSSTERRATPERQETLRSQEAPKPQDAPKAQNTSKPQDVPQPDAPAMRALTPGSAVAANAGSKPDKTAEGVVSAGSPSIAAKPPAGIAPALETPAPSAGKASQDAAPVQRDVARPTGSGDAVNPGTATATADAGEDIKPGEPAKAPELADDPFSIDAIEQEFARLLGQGAPPKS